MRWTYWLLDLPASIVTVWLTILRVYFLIILSLAVLATWSSVMVSLVLWLLGIRWGW